MANGSQAGNYATHTHRGPHRLHYLYLKTQSASLVCRVLVSLTQLKSYLSSCQHQLFMYPLGAEQHSLASPGAKIIENIIMARDTA